VKFWHVTTKGQPVTHGVTYFVVIFKNARIGVKGATQKVRILLSAVGAEDAVAPPSKNFFGKID